MLRLISHSYSLTNMSSNPKRLLRSLRQKKIKFYFSFCVTYSQEVKKHISPSLISAPKTNTNDLISCLNWDKLYVPFLPFHKFSHPLIQFRILILSVLKFLLSAKKELWSNCRFWAICSILRLKGLGHMGLLHVGTQILSFLFHLPHPSRSKH